MDSVSTLHRAQPLFPMCRHTWRPSHQDRQLAVWDFPRSAFIRCRTLRIVEPGAKPRRRRDLLGPEWWAASCAWRIYAGILPPPGMAVKGGKEDRRRRGLSPTSPIIAHIYPKIVPIGTISKIFFPRGKVIVRA